MSIHPTHETRPLAEGSSDKICNRCGATTTAPGYGAIDKPCENHPTRFPYPSQRLTEVGR